MHTIGTPSVEICFEKRVSYLQVPPKAGTRTSGPVPYHHNNLFRDFIHRPVRKDRIEPYVTLVIPIYNESGIIGAKIRNAASLDYPVNKLEVLIASDGSSDDTVETAQRLSDGTRIRVLPFLQNRGKMSVLNDAVQEAKGEIIVFSDASAILDSGSLRQLVTNFVDLLRARTRWKPMAAQTASSTPAVLLLFC